MPNSEQPDVTCRNMGEFLSARVDRETTSVENRRIDAHLETCVDCADLADRLTAFDRRMRFRSAEPVPDLVGAISERTRPAVLGRGGWLRPAMAWTAVILFAQNVMILISGTLEGADDHLARHLGAFGVALAIGFAYVAWKPHRAHGMLPFAAALILTIAVSAIADVADGGRTVIAESAHVTEVIGLVLLWMIAGSPGWARFADRFRPAPRVS